MNIVIFGASSAIAQVTARQWAIKGSSFFLVDRDSTRLEAVASDLRVRGSKKVVTCEVDLNNIAEHESLVANAVKVFGRIDVVLISYGILGVQGDVREVMETVNTNYVSVISLLMALRVEMERQRSGSILVITSVAGDRGRKSNYVYGSAKGGLSVFVAGLRHRLSGTGIRVVDIKPGLVDTPMTKDFSKGFLWSSPEVISRYIIGAAKGSRGVVYAPWYWYWIMLVIRCMPDRIFNKTNL